MNDADSFNLFLTPQPFLLLFWFLLLCILLVLIHLGCECTSCDNESTNKELGQQSTPAQTRNRSLGFFRVFRKQTIYVTYTLLCILVRNIESKKERLH